MITWATSIRSIKLKTGQDKLNEEKDWEPKFTLLQELKNGTGILFIVSIKSINKHLSARGLI